MALSDSIVIGPDRNGRAVSIVDGRVAATSAPPGAARLACPDCDIAPGAVCAHTHIYSGLARYGMKPPHPPPETFVQMLERVWWRLDRALDAEILRAAARDYAARALLAGTTTLVDHHESPNLIEGSLSILADVCQELGVRALLCYGATERNFGRAEARRGLAECRRVAASPLLRGLVGLHASFTVSDDTMREAGDLARELGTVVHVHVAEDQADVDDARAARRGRAARAPLVARRAAAGLDPRAWRAPDAEQVRARLGRRVLARAQSALQRGQPGRLRARRCRRRAGWRWAPTAGTPTWRTRRPPCCGSPNVMATVAWAAGWRPATLWRRSVSAPPPSARRPARWATSWRDARAKSATWSSADGWWSSDGQLTTGDMDCHRRSRANRGGSSVGSHGVYLNEGDEQWRGSEWKLVWSTATFTSERSSASAKREWRCPRSAS